MQKRRRSLITDSLFDRNQKIDENNNFGIVF